MILGHWPLPGFPWRYVSLHLLFEPRDLWIGAYWTRYREATYPGLRIYICLIPMLPLMIEVWPL